MNPLTMFSCTFRHDTTLQQHRLLSVTANVTEPSGERTSENAQKAKFAEFLYSTLRFLLWPSLSAVLYASIASSSARDMTKRSSSLPICAVEATHGLRI